MPRKDIKKSGKLGFTLVETICALALLTVVFAGFMTLAASAARLNTHALRLGAAFDASAADLERGQNITAATETFTLDIGGSTFPLTAELHTTQGEYPLTAFTPVGG